MRYRSLVLLLALFVLAYPAFPQGTGDSGPVADPGASTEPAADPGTTKTKPASVTNSDKPVFIRPTDQRGINVFEPPKGDDSEFSGVKLDLGAAFTQRFQGMKHRNTASALFTNGVNVNSLMRMGLGFNTAAANLYLSARLAKGIHVSMTSYLASRHHNETWVKDGYLQIDGSPIDMKILNGLMRDITIKAGHFEVDYGDAHFRRSDNGMAIYNPFVGNYIVDAFTTEIGAAAYFRPKSGLIAMASIMNGEIKGNVLQPQDRAPSFIGKLGFDRQLNDKLRVRLTGSAYTNKKSPANTLFAGDRAGTAYFFVMENTLATTTANATSGQINPNFRHNVKAYQVNPFIKYGGLELFGVAEQATGRAANEVRDRTIKQYAADLVYRFANDQFFVGARRNLVKGELFNMPQVSARRTQISLGWFLTKNILTKAEYVNQRYSGFPSADIRNGGRFHGVVFEGSVAF